MQNGGKVLMSCLMQELHRSIEQERICLLPLDSVPPLSFCPGILGMNGCQFGFEGSASRGENRVWWGSLCASTCGDESRRQYSSH